jgi:hypothetical protein
MKKLGVLLGLLLSLPLAVAGPVDTFRQISGKFVQFGNLSFLGLTDATVITSLMRILVWFLVFTIFFAISSNEHVVKIINKKFAMVISFIVATISAIFLSDALLKFIGSGAASLVAFILIGGPVVGVGYLLWKIPGKDNEEHTGHVFLKLCLCVFLLWILGSIKFHLMNLGG